MTADEIIQKAYLHANRKAIPPAVGTSKYETLLSIVDSMQKLWATEPGVEWDSLYALVSVGSISATDTFPIDTTIQYLSKREGDYAIASNGTSSKTYTIVKPNQLYAYRNNDVVAQVGRNLKFPSAFSASSSVFGYGLSVPAILYPDDITDGSDVVQVDDPMWLAYMSAYEFVRNDLVKRNTKDDLLAYAEQSMIKMKQANGGQYNTVSTPWTPAGESWI